MSRELEAWGDYVKIGIQSFMDEHFGSVGWGPRLVMQVLPELWGTLQAQGLVRFDATFSDFEDAAFDQYILYLIRTGAGVEAFQLVKDRGTHDN